MKKLKNKFLDLYLGYPIFCDSVLLLILFLTHKYGKVIDFQLLDRSNQINIISNLIGTCVSLAGFILAALTIIVTFKSNLKAKKIEESESPLELILSSSHYSNIVQAFKMAITEFVLSFFLLYILWASSNNFSLETLNFIVCSGIIAVSSTILRSLMILFKILSLDKTK